MKLHQDFRAFLELLNAKRVEYKRASGRAKDLADIEALGEQISPNEPARTTA